MKFIILISSLFLINFISCSKSETIIDWGFKNNLEISPLIELSSEKDSIKFIAKEDIDDKKELLKIPYTMMLDVEKSLNLINLNELKAQYEQYKEMEKKDNTKYKILKMKKNKVDMIKDYELLLKKVEKKFDTLYLVHSKQEFLNDMKMKQIEAQNEMARSHQRKNTRRIS